MAEERIWTSSQRSAIDTRDRTLLVSAAAGSGKTATLTERIITSILDEENPINIDEMLIVTYTRAAVGELSERIGVAIKSAAKERVGDEGLERQLRMLPAAKICTIDSFCAEILRANAERVGVSPTFRVPDAAEAKLLGENILDGLIDAIFEGKAEEIATPLEIDALTDCLAQTRNQKDLPEIIQHIYTSTLDSLEGVESIGALVSEFDPTRFTSVENTAMGKYCMARIKELKEHYLSAISEIRKEVAVFDGGKYTDILDMLDEALNILNALGPCEKYNDVREVLMRTEFMDSPKVPRNKGLPPVSDVRGRFKNELIEMREDLFFAPESDWRVAYEGLYRQFGVLYRIVKEFDRLFRAEKNRRGILEFSDIERYTYECLWQNGEKTDVAHAQSGLYKAVYIDEYQDVNSLQNKIFDAISTDTNRFMVGDIKQSIYEFRSANPRIFANMKKTYTPLGENGDFPYASIFMSDNFRCDEGVIDFVNDIFDSVFGYLRNSIGYVSGDRLNFSKKYKHQTPSYCYPEICLVPTISKKDPRYALVEDQATLVPDVIARKIRELLDNEYLDNGEKIQPKHIAIIMRKVKSRAALYTQVLSQYNIPVAVAENDVFFINSDVLLVLSLLNSIDNPHKDIYLAGLMCSPIYGFTVGDLALIRKKAPASTLLDSLKIYTESDEGGERVRKFLEKLNCYRLISEGMPTDKLLIKLYHETGLLALASNRKESKENLMLLYEHARKFEAGSFRGLYNFISYINQLTGRSSEFDKREAPGECDAVRIVTAHGSKGLEYPIVFFAGADASFRMSGGKPGEAPRFEYEEGFGMGMNLRTSSGLAIVRNSTKDIVKHYRYRKKIEEEARVLYVILTRARERLYVVSKSRTKVDEYLSEMASMREYMSDYDIYNVSSFLDMILTAKDFDVKLPSEFLINPPPVYSNDGKIPEKDGDLPDDGDTHGDFIADLPDDSLSGNDKNIAELEKLLNDRFNFVYANAHLCAIPGKLSVSKLYPEILDGADDSAVDISSDSDESEPTEKKIRLPRFISGEANDESARRGIATHMLMQFCDFEALASSGARKELERLTESGFLSKEDASLVRLYEADRFASSKLIRDIMNAKSVYREFRFNVKLPAEQFTMDKTLKELYRGESVLVQGVIDCLYEDNDGEWHLVDYKTDRLTKEELSDKELARRKMCQKHSAQLAYYAEAVELMFGKYPKTIEVYSLPLADTLDVSVQE